MQCAILWRTYSFFWTLFKKRQTQIFVTRNLCFTFPLFFPCSYLFIYLFLSFFVIILHLYLVRFLQSLRFCDCARSLYYRYWYMFSFLYDIECLVYHSVIFYDKRKKQRKLKGLSKFLKISADRVGNVLATYGLERTIFWGWPYDDHFAYGISKAYSEFCKHLRWSFLRK